MGKEVKELDRSGYRAAMVEKRYQAQVKCTGCGQWTLTTNLEVFKNDDFIRTAEAKDVTCMNSGCGEVQEHLILNDWPYSAPVKWREGSLKKKATS